ncbi:protein spaetzle 3 [Trichonephila inaurata madagascariensis]|uniref:Protein spaetzle 3 n=1 Tax=Trichonephila inaurata madagascariensis TaxID=2747483 RepID=A0A8X6XQ65_9ARAC|nr:protein spaetzle 3 [Trichonephila inaurata madagascariensis]
MCSLKVLFIFVYFGALHPRISDSEISRGVPCIKRLNQLYCPSPGQNYPQEKIETFIDENKALIKRMFGDYTNAPVDGEIPDSFETYDGKKIHVRSKRASPKNTFSAASSNKVDACESAVEIVTPYWASNSAGKLRAIVNTQHLQQAIHQEVCQSTQTKKCASDCTCEQKYKWHRLLAYDPDDDCKGIFMDWFLFPSCCICRCTPPLKSK